ncbi:MAG: hypothetical protein OEQ39_19790 [Gammaproteobacteria bacterium]|nr:hypothetical protein [Gammaproteobacteria bacterium]
MARDARRAFLERRGVHPLPRITFGFNPLYEVALEVSPPYALLTDTTVPIQRSCLLNGSGALGMIQFGCARSSFHQLSSSFGVSLSMAKGAFLPEAYLPYCHGWTSRQCPGRRFRSRPPLWLADHQSFWANMGTLLSSIIIIDGRSS